jgi:hypothetical protein
MYSPHINRKRELILSYESRYAKPLARTSMGLLTGSHARSDSTETHVSCHKRTKHASQFSQGPVTCYDSFDGKFNADQDYDNTIWSRARAAQFLHVVSKLTKGEGRAISGADFF